jgi:hypothetical protein
VNLIIREIWGWEVWLLSVQFCHELSQIQRDRRANEFASRHLNWAENLIPLYSGFSQFREGHSKGGPVFTILLELPKAESTGNKFMNKENCDITVTTLCFNNRSGGGMKKLVSKLTNAFVRRSPKERIRKLLDAPRNVGA